MDKVLQGISTQRKKLNHLIGVRYNAEKKTVGKYYSTPIIQFRMKCHLCDNYIEIQTDPKVCFVRMKKQQILIHFLCRILHMLLLVAHKRKWKNGRRRIQK